MLEAALQCKREFTQQEWDTFGIEGIRADSFVKSGNSYFRPAVGAFTGAFLEGDLVFENADGVEPSVLL